MIVEREFEWRVFTLLHDQETVKDFMDSAPPRCMEMMRAGLERSPHTEEDWGKMLMCGSNMSLEEGKRLIQESRKGVEAVRQYLEGGN